MIQKFDKSILSKDRIKEIFNFIKENNIDMSNIATKELFIQNGFLQCFLRKIYRRNAEKAKKETEGDDQWKSFATLVPMKSQ